ncbi:MAG: Fic family protein [Treponema sp.]|nr:Fic family protein [Treponema sp.]
MEEYIYQNDKYPCFSWDNSRILEILTRTAVLQGKVLGKMQQLGFGLQQEAMLNALTEEITKSSEIEGEILNSEQVRSSLARQLDINLEKETVPSHRIEGMVETMMDAVRNFQKPLSKTRLFGWHASLFPTGYSGMYRIRVGKFRDNEMQVVSQRSGRDRVHYQAPPPKDVPVQMADFLDWLNKDGNENPLIKAAIAHLWFVIIHPFDDGNGRLTRIITEMLLARAENTSLRFYSMSAQIQKEKKGYYKILEKITSGGLDITEWLQWFFECLCKSITASDSLVGIVLRKASFWQQNSLVITNAIQHDIINRLFDGFTGNLTSGKAAKIYKVSQDTVARLLKDLVDKNILEIQGAGRSTHYVLKAN